MDTVTTTILISNLHCSSCVTTIRDVLSSLSPPPISINTSIVSQTVSVQHPPDLSSDTIKDALEDAGFDLVSTPKLEAFRLRRSPSFRPDWLAKKREKHAEQCLLCQQEQAALLKDYTSSDTLAPIASHVPSITATLVHPLTLSKDDNRLSTALDPPSQPMPDPLFTVAFSVGGMTCASCVGNITRALEEIQGVSQVAVNLVGKSATAVITNKDLVKDIKEAIEDSGYEADLMNVEPVNSKTTTGPQAASSSSKKEDKGPYHAVFSVGGMTCASCVGNVTRATSELAGVTDVSVNLVGKSATATLENKDLVNDFIEATEDSGYECQLISIEPLNKEDAEESESGPRIIALRVDGMFCKHCPGKVLTALKKFGDKVSVVDPLPDYPTPKPIIRLSYKPSPPSLTIRSIISAIESAKSPPFQVSIARPPSLEERAKRMHAKEQLNLLYRLLSSVIIAIPTFIIAVVFMSLIPSSNTTRKFFMKPMWTGNSSRIQWALFFLATPAMFYSAGQFHRRSLKEIWGLWRPGSKAPLLRRFVRFGSMNLLVSMGVSIAYFSSIALLALAASQPPSPSGMGDTTTYFDSVVFLTMFLLCGRYLEAYSKGRTADAIDALGKLRPSEALLLVHDSVKESNHTPRADVDVEKGEVEDEALRSEKLGVRIKKVRAEFLEIGDIVRVPHGASPPADGIIISLSGGSFDESSLTGESKPIKKTHGDHVFVGTLNRGNVVEVKIDTLGGETMLDRIVKVVRDGQAKRAPIERVADILTGYFIPAITLLAILTWIIWLVLGVSGVLPRDYLDIPIGGWTVWALEFAIAVFVVACPCGIGLAAPTALLVGSGLAAKFGILVRGGGEAFQEAAQLDLIVFDKTGTLTVGGEPRITNSFFTLSGTTWTRSEILNTMHTLESSSSHPLASAVRKFCEDEDGIKLVDIGVVNVEEVAGKGLKGTFDELKCTAIVGNEDWISGHGAELTAEQDEYLAKWKSEGKSVILFAISRTQTNQDSGETENKFQVVAILAASDELRPEAQGVVAALQKQGLSIWMISGDNAITAKAVAKTVGIPETNVIAGVLPHQKAEKVAWLQQVGMKRERPRWQRVLGLKQLNERCIVAMVGDGINDAPALTTADVGIAIGSGSDVAISSASFILIKSNLKSILTLTDLSRKVFNRVKFNFVWALMYNLAALPIAAGVIYPAGHARLNPVWASLAMALSSVTVVTSSLLLRLYKAPKI